MPNNTPLDNRMRWIRNISWLESSDPQVVSELELATEANVVGTTSYQDGAITIRPFSMQQDVAGLYKVLVCTLMAPLEEPDELLRVRNVHVLQQVPGRVRDPVERRPIRVREEVPAGADIQRPGERRQQQRRMCARRSRGRSHRQLPVHQHGREEAAARRAPRARRNRLQG